MSGLDVVLIDDESVAVLEPDSFVIGVENTEVDVVSVGEAGPAGLDGLNGAGQVSERFAFGDATPKVITIAIGGKLVTTVTIIITQPFNGASPALTVGSAGAPDGLMQADQNDPTFEGEYEANPGVQYGIDTQILLTITPGMGASQGAGLVVIEMEA